MFVLHMNLQLKTLVLPIKLKLVFHQMVKAEREHFSQEGSLNLILLLLRQNKEERLSYMSSQMFV